MTALITRALMVDHVQMVSITTRAFVWQDLLEIIVALVCWFRPLCRLCFILSIFELYSSVLQYLLNTQRSKNEYKNKHHSEIN